MKTRVRLVAISLLGGLIVAGLLAPPGPTSAQRTGVITGELKLPDGYMPAPMTRFKGMMALAPKRPAGMFIFFPDNGESTEQLRTRIRTLVLPMFIHDEKGKPNAPITWDTKPLPTHPGDTEGKAEANLYQGNDQEIQVVIYERPSDPLVFLYGYFAMRHKAGKDDDGKFVDEQGNGVKVFDKFWKSLPKPKAVK